MSLTANDSIARRPTAVKFENVTRKEPGPLSPGTRTQARSKRAALLMFRESINVDEERMSMRYSTDKEVTKPWGR